MKEQNGSKKALKIAALLVAGLLVLGAAKSFARGGWGGPWDGDRTDRISRELGLTDDQETKVRKIVRDAEKKREELTDKYRDSRKAEYTDMEKLRADTEASVNSVLTDDQKAKFKEFNESRRGRGGFKGFGGRGCDTNGPGDCWQGRGEAGKPGCDTKGPGDCANFGKGPCR